jgi:hypothetical protein
MKNFPDLLDKYNQSFDKNIEALKEQYNRAISNQSSFNRTLNMMDMSAINKCFKELKLEATISTIGQNFNLTGYVTLGITARPLPGCKIKPLVFSHYVKGNSSNSKKRDERSRALSEKITELTGYQSSTNQFSFEVKSKTEDFSILIDMKIPLAK